MAPTIGMASMINTHIALAVEFKFCLFSLFKEATISETQTTGINM